MDVVYEWLVTREERDAADSGVLNERATELNEEAADVLEYQVPL